MRDVRSEHHPKGGLAGSHSHAGGGSATVGGRQGWCSISKGDRRSGCKMSSRAVGSDFWGQHVWARSYFCPTDGAVDGKVILEYIESQKWKQNDQGFKIIAPAET
jgi:hypothetical protein